MVDLKITACIPSVHTKGEEWNLLQRVVIICFDKSGSKDLSLFHLTQNMLSAKSAMGVG